LRFSRETFVEAEHAARHGYKVYRSCVYIHLASHDYQPTLVPTDPEAHCEQLLQLVRASVVPHAPSAPSRPRC
jgi:hypothetical protein